MFKRRENKTVVFNFTPFIYFKSKDGLVYKVWVKNELQILA